METVYVTWCDQIPPSHETPDWSPGALTEGGLSVVQTGRQAPFTFPPRKVWESSSPNGEDFHTRSVPSYNTLG